MDGHLLGPQTVAALQVTHGVVHGLIFLGFLFQGWLGLRIRRTRSSGQPPVPGVNRGHRRLGPLLVLASDGGYLGGLAITFLDGGRLVKWPMHFAGGTAAVLALAAAFFLSRRIRGLKSPARAQHALAGLLLILLYAVQVLTGLAVIA